MRAKTLINTLACVALVAMTAAIACAAPTATFSTTEMDVAANSSYTTSAIIIQSATGVTNVSLQIKVPDYVSISTTLDGVGNLACVTKGSDVDTFFFSEWDPGTRTIGVTATVKTGSTLEVVSSIAFSTTASVAVGEMEMTGDFNSGALAGSFAGLDLYPPHTVAFDPEPSIDDNDIDSGGSVTCSASAADSQEHDIDYTWSDGSAGGSFAPSANVANPTYTAAANTTGSNRTVTLTCTAACSEVSSVKDTATVTLTVRSHHINFSAAPTVSASTVNPGQTTNCSVTAVDTMGHDLDYAWSDGGAGGGFSNAAIADPVYTAPNNETGSNINVTLTCTVTCAEVDTITDSGTVQVTVTPVPPAGIDVTSEPYENVSITFSPTPDLVSKASPQNAPFSLSYLETAQDVTLTAPEKSGGPNPRYFSHWVVDDVNQPVSQKNVTIDMEADDHTAKAVYDRLIGDVDNDDDVDEDDAHLVLQQIFDELDNTIDINYYDTDGDDEVNLKDAEWILNHKYQEEN